ncbi:MAG: MFS transporter, partial [Sphaerochaetaceae bacterium]|nr:MFS transporter [Sphaerochaetaceae bacterium]
MDLNRSMQLQSRILNSTSFMAQFAIAMINLALVYHMRLQFNLSPQLIGVSASIYTFTYFISCLALGPIATRLKPRHSVSLSVAGMGISIAVVMVTTSIAVAFVALAGYGIAMSFLWPQIETWLARGKEGRALNKATSSFNVSWSLGAATSPLLTGILVEIHTQIG